MVASNVEIFNISGLTSSTGSGEGTILEFDSSGNIIPSAGTYNTVSKIDTELSSLQGGVTTNTSDIATLLSGGTVFTTGSFRCDHNNYKEVDEVHQVVQVLMVHGQEVEEEEVELWKILPFL